MFTPYTVFARMFVVAFDFALATRPTRGSYEDCSELNEPQSSFETILNNAKARMPDIRCRAGAYRSAPCGESE